MPSPSKGVARQLKLRGWEGAYVLRIDARSMELLCEGLGSKRLTMPAEEQVRPRSFKASVPLTPNKRMRHLPRL